MRRLVVAIAAVCLAAIGLAASSPAIAAGGTCTGPISGTTTGSLTVPSDEATGVSPCVLDAVTVKGSVTVQPGGDLTVTGSGSTITGSIVANSPERIHIFLGHISTTTNKIGGSLTINGSSSDALESEICGVDIGGSVNVSRVTQEVSIDGDPSEACSTVADGSATPAQGGHTEVTIGGAVTLQSNAGEVELSDIDVTGSVNVINNSHGDTSGSADIEANDIGGTLACSGNVNGVNNDGETNAATTKTGQCVGK